MIFYHGTSLKRAKEIEQDRLIKSTGIPLTHGNNLYYPTEQGFVYLTNYLYSAIHYAILSSELIDNTYSCAIFKVDIDPRFLLADEQDISIVLRTKEIQKAYSFEESLDICASVKVPNDLNFGKEVISYATFNYVLPAKSELALNIKEACSKAVQYKKYKAPDISESLFTWNTL